MRLTPRPTVHRTLLFRCGGPYPFEETVHVEYVAALSPYYHHHKKRISRTFQKNNRPKREGRRRKKEEEAQLSGQSSPGILQLGQQPSNGTLQMPQTSPSSSVVWCSVPVSQRHVATACQCFTVTFIGGGAESKREKLNETLFGCVDALAMDHVSAFLSILHPLNFAYYQPDSNST